MPESKPKMTYDEWVDYCFDRPVSDPQWYWDACGEPSWYVPDAAEITKFMTRLFEDAGDLVTLYSLEQVDQGLHFICGIGSGYFYRARECDDRALQIEWVLSILCLYRDLFAKVCTHHFGHRDAGPEPPSALNVTCYMIWDLDTRPQEKHLIDPVFEVLEGALRLSSVACQESALHGLGHLQMDHTMRVCRVIDDYLKRNRNLPEELKSYALSARSGCVL